MSKSLTNWTLNLPDSNRILKKNKNETFLMIFQHCVRLKIKISTVIGFASICKDTTHKNIFGFFGWCVLCIGYTCRFWNNEANTCETKTKLKNKYDKSMLKLKYNLLSDLRKNPSCFSLTKSTPSFSNLCEGWPKARAATSLLLNLILPEDRTACK